jgi:hypothetical protein
MDPSEVLAVLARYTAELQPFEASTTEQLRELRAAVAANSDSVFAPDMPTKPQISLNAALQTELESLAASGAVALATPVRIFRKTIPSRTEFKLLATPAWARAALPSKTLGPFLGPDAAIYWFDLYPGADTVTLGRDVDGAPLFLVPTNVTRAGNRFTFGPGAAAISTAFLTGTGATGEMCPLRVRGGSIQFSLTPVEASPGVFRVPRGAQATAVFQFEPATTDGASVQLTHELRLAWTPIGPVSAEVDSFRYTAAGTTVQFNAAAARFTYDSTLGGARLQLKQAGDAAVLDFGTDAKGTHVLEGHSAIQSASYVLLSADASGGLPQPAGSGYLEMELAGDLRGRGPALPSSGAQFRTPTLLVNPLVTTARTSARSFIHRQNFSLWREDASSQASSLEIAIPAESAVEFSFPESGGSSLIASATIAGRCSRPRLPDGSWLDTSELAGFADTYTDAGKVRISVTAENAFATGVSGPEMSLVLENALLKVVRPGAFSVFGTLGSAEVKDGFAGLLWRLTVIVPILPDPYAANIGAGQKFIQGQPGAGYVASGITWKGGVLATFALRLLADTQMPLADPLLCGPFVDTPEPTGGGIFARSFVPGPAEPAAAVQTRFASTINASTGGGRCAVLLDLSSNADRFGIEIMHASGRNASVPGTAAYAIRGMTLEAPAQNIRLMTLPLVSWDPVYNIPNPDVGPFPPILASSTDGGPTMMARFSVALVPAHPLAIYAEALAAYAAESIVRPFAMLFTLPYGMIALARLSKAADAAGRSAALAETRPQFPTVSSKGGHQLTVRSTGKTPGGASPSLPGTVTQTRNGVDPATGAPLNLSVLDDGLGNTVATIFDETFGATSKDPHIPLKRLDLSGYGGSIHSDWVNPLAEVADIREARFDVNVGRTAYEVVQAASLLYPWAVHVLRSVTMERTGGGGVVRRDSGWIAASDGVFDFRVGGVDPGIVTHPGVVRGVTNVRGIRETGQRYTDLGADLVEVKFDADVYISEPLLRGASGAGRVVSLQQTGYIQVAPRGVPLTPAQYAGLVTTKGPLGGPVDCVIDVGSSGEHMRVLQTEVALAPDVSGPQFAAAAYGSPSLPKDGQWSVVALAAGGPATPVDPQRGTPLIREGNQYLAPAANPNPFRFGDPADLLNPVPASDLGLLHVMGTQRVLFTRPKIERGSHAFTSVLPPLLADVYGLLANPGVFPPAAGAIPFPSAAYSLDVIGDAMLRYSSPSPAFTVTGQRVLVPGPSTKLYGDYEDDAGTATTVSYSLDSSASPAWRFSMGPVSTVIDWAAFPQIMRMVFSVGADAATAPQFTNPKLVFGSAFAPLNTLMAILTDLGLASAFNPSFTNPSKYQLQAALTIPLTQTDAEGRQDDTVWLGLRPDMTPPTFETPPCIVPFLNNTDVKVGFLYGAYFGQPADWSAFFELEMQLWFPIVPDKCVHFLLLGKIHLETDAQHGTTVLVQIGGGLGWTFKFLGNEAKLWAAIAIDLVFGDTESALGISLLVGFSVDLFDIVEVQVQAEARGVLVTDHPLGGTAITRCLVGQFTAQIEVSIFLVLDFEATFEYDMDKRISGQGDCNAITTP